MKFQFSFRESGWNLIPILILGFIFAYYFTENFILSESWEVLSLRSIDDYAMQDSVRSMQRALLSGDWKRVFGFFDYAYGNAFWLFNAILLFPFYFIDNAQVLIVVGRQVSLIFVFSSIYIVGLVVDKLRPNAGSLKYPILIALATMPMVAIISTKLHVNAQSIFFGLLSFYILIKPKLINSRSILLSALFAALAIGFKLTGIFITPLLCILLLDKLRVKGIKNATLKTAGYLAFIIALAMILTAPKVILFPFFINDLELTYKTFSLFKNMQSSEIQISKEFLLSTFSFYFHPFGLSVIFISFALLIFDDIKKRSFTSLYIFCSIALTILVLIITTHKGPDYIATYFLSVAFFIPLGLLGVGCLKLPLDGLKITLAYCLIAATLFYGAGDRENLLRSYDFFAMSKSEPVKRQIAALSQIRDLIYPLTLPVRILQDSSSIFPATRFTDGVDANINYGNLAEKSTWGDFDYILLNSDTYYGRKLDCPSPKKTNSQFGESHCSLEEATRKTLRETGFFYGRKYILIYSGYDALLYKLEK